MTAPTVPGVYEGVDERVYHGDRGSLSSSGARQLNRMTPFRWRWEQQQPRDDIAEHFLIGTAVHTIVLGTGAEIVEVPYDSFQGKAARAMKREAIAAGMVPILSKRIPDVEYMAAALLGHPVAGGLLRGVRTEVSAYAPIRGAAGLMRRARADAIVEGPGGRIAADVKTTDSVATADLEKSIWSYGYHAQDPWYCDVFADAGMPLDAFVFLFVEKSEPYEVRVVELPPSATDLGRAANQRALDTWVRCKQTGVWPGHAPVIHQIDVPRWAYKQEEFR